MSRQSHHQGNHHGHTARDHGSGGHGHGHGPVVHGVAAGAQEAYAEAYEAAVPDAGRSVVQVELEAAEVDWEFTPGRGTRAWVFNGTVPGPTIEAQVGDVLEINFHNSLPEPTSIHWHGLQVPVAMDGTDMVQHPIVP